MTVDSFIDRQVHCRHVVSAVCGRGKTWRRWLARALILTHNNIVPTSHPRRAEEDDVYCFSLENKTK